jgi:hypothetical protein
LWPYLIAYELAEPDLFAPVLASVLLDLGATQLTADAWLITSDWNASAILEQLRPIIGDSDRLMVLELGEDLAAVNIDEPPPADQALPPFPRKKAQTIN